MLLSHVIEYSGSAEPAYFTEIDDLLGPDGLVTKRAHASIDAVFKFIKNVGISMSIGQCEEPSLDIKSKYLTPHRALEAWTQILFEGHAELAQTALHHPLIEKPIKCIPISKPKKRQKE